MHHAIGLGALLTAISFAFGERAARFVVGSVLIAGALAFGSLVVLVVIGAV